MDILGIAYLGFESPNAKAWTEFGPEVLGMQLLPNTVDETTYLKMDDRRWRLAFHPGETDQLTYIGWELKWRPSWEAAIATLEGEGFDVTRESDEFAEQRGVREVASFTDPSGYRHELVYGQKFDPGSFIPGRPHRGFIAGRDGVGHVVMLAPAAEGLDHFWQDIMGFEWFGAGAGGVGSTRGGGFFRAKLNGLTHNLGILPAPGMTGIHHIGIPVKSVDDVGIAYDLCKERDVPIHRLIGRHTQDPVISFYTFTPSGFIIEYLSPVVDNDVDAFYETNPEKLSVWGHEIVGPMMPSTIHPVATS
jgi:2,3-dihydroxybiphenyl 1,2-dioxygenase